MKKRNCESNGIFEDREISGAVDLSTVFFEKNIRGVIEGQFEKYIGSWPLKKGFLDSIEGGKRLRATCTILFCRIAGGKVSNGKQIAAAMELIHCASLIIDDELDKRNVRPDRRVPTIRGKYSSEEAMMIMALDVLLASDLVFRASDEFNETRRNKIRNLFVRTVCEGGMGEILKWKYIQDRRIPTSESYWKELVRSSGALFFQMACEIGTLAATTDKNILDKVTVIGYQLGELLQAGDDVKDTKEDMRDGFYSLAIINYYNSLKENEKQEFEKKLKQGFSERELDYAYKEIAQSRAMEKTLQELKEKGDKIIGLLEDLPKCKETEYMIRIVNYLRERMQIKK